MTPCVLTKALKPTVHRRLVAAVNSIVIAHGGVPDTSDATHPGVPGPVQLLRVAPGSC